MPWFNVDYEIHKSRNWDSVTGRQHFILVIVKSEDSTGMIQTHNPIVILQSSSLTLDQATSHASLNTYT